MNEKKRAKPINIIFKIIENTFFNMFTSLNNLDRIQNIKLFSSFSLNYKYISFERES